MAGIGFELAKMARSGGVSGVAAAAAHGAVISAGPWLLSAVAIGMFQLWSRDHARPADAAAIQVVLIYAFSVSALVAAPIIAVVTRAVADLLHAEEAGGIPGLLAAALASVTLGGLIAGAILHAAAGLDAIDQLLATGILVLLAQIWVANLFLTAVRRHRVILMAYGAGIAIAALATRMLENVSARLLLALVLGTLIVVVTLLIAAIRQSFAAVPIWPAAWRDLFRRHAHIAAAGLAGTIAVWIDKWLLWLGPGSVAALGVLRHNPIYDTASFLGLLSMIPGLTLLLIVSETRFDRSFATLMDACTGSGTVRRIEQARRAVGGTIVENLRLLFAAQATIAVLLWVLAPRLFELVGGDPRGIFAFRFTVVGGVFHLLVVATTIMLAYFDLFGRVLAVWGVFAVVSAVATIANFDAGFVREGWSYLAGAVVGAAVGVGMVAQAVGNLSYLLFVGNNPAVMGERRRWA